MWRNFHAAGARCLVTSGVVETREIAQLYCAAIPGADFTLCRLRATPAELRARIVYRGQLRGVGTQGAGAWLSTDSLNERAVFAARYAEELDRDDIADFCVDTDGVKVPEVERRVRAGAGNWPQLPDVR
jgi:hypothetical protein